MVNIYDILIDFIGPDFSSGALRRVLESIQEAINVCDRAISDVQKNSEPDYIDAVGDTECDVIEALIGTAFVTAQTEITATASRVKRLHNKFKRDRPDFTLSTTTSAKANIFHTSSPIVRSPYSAVEILNGFANYFKHRDEWDAQWRNATPPQQDTIAVIMAAGAEPGSTGNLRTAAHVLGADGINGLIEFSEIIANWRKSLAAGYEAELRSLDLL